MRKLGAMETRTAPLYDCLVIGGGPAGLSAALQTARFNRRVMLFDAGGGRASYHQVNHNYLGFPGGLKARETDASTYLFEGSPAQLRDLLRAHPDLFDAFDGTSKTLRMRRAKAGA